MADEKIQHLTRHRSNGWVTTWCKVRVLDDVQSSGSELEDFELELPTCEPCLAIRQDARRSRRNELAEEDDLNFAEEGCCGEDGLPCGVCDECEKQGLLGDYADFD